MEEIKSDEINSAIKDAKEKLSGMNMKMFEPLPQSKMKHTINHSSS